MFDNGIALDAKWGCGGIHFVWSHRRHVHSLESSTCQSTCVLILENMHCPSQLVRHEVVLIRLFKGHGWPFTQVNPGMDGGHIGVLKI
jgi:hypothetical protein